MDQRWYVVQTKPREELRGLRELSRQGITSICPLTREYRWRRRQYETVPLFPGYIFTRFVFPDQYYTIKWTRGIRKLVQLGDHPSYLDDDFIEGLRLSMDSDGIIDLSPTLHKGDKVRFHSGPLEGLVGTVLRLETAQDRVLVLMEHLAYQARLKVDTHHLEAI